MNRPSTAAGEAMPKTIVKDPLLIAIAAYKAGLDDFNLNAPHDNDDALNAYADVSYGPPLAVLQQWTGAASSQEGAIEALRLALNDDGGLYGSEGADRMVEAVLEYLEGDRTCRAAPLMDPLLDVITEYRNGIATLNAIPENHITRENEEQIYQETYGKYEDVLDAWDQPAATREGAIAALVLMGERDMFEDIMGEPLRKAVLGYLEAQGGAL